MKSFSKVLVPIDFSEYSTEAVHAAADLARRFDSSITLIHVYDPLAYALPDGFVLATEPGQEQLFSAFRAQLASAQREALDAGAPRVDTKLLDGSIAGQIVDYATRGEFDLIVMGTHGRTGVSHLVIGSSAERVVRLAPCPVLTVKKPSRQRAA